MVMLMEIGNKLAKLLLGEVLFAIVILLHEIDQNHFILSSYFASLIKRIVQGTHNISQQFKGHYIVQMILKDKGSEYLLIGKFLFIHEL